MISRVINVMRKVTPYAKEYENPRHVAMAFGACVGTTVAVPYMMNEWHLYHKSPYRHAKLVGCALTAYAAWPVFASTGAIGLFIWSFSTK